ncbi:uncharacterized protein [Dermacentor albipictus]|uniref:uncharacterized protein n=1 Tax=Dermacentor albipictus TaxID=60249 RepID=UPI0038FBF082
MPQRCFVPGCTEASTGGEVRHYFRPPRDDSLFEAWHEAIARPDDKRMNAKSRVCHIHFHAEDIMREFAHNVNGELVVIPREKWALKEGAIPLIFPSYPKFLSKKVFLQQRQSRSAARKRPQPSLFEDPESPRNERPADIDDDDGATPEAAHQRAIDEAKEAARRRLFEEILAVAQKGGRFHGWSVDTAGDDSVVFYKLRMRDRLVQIDRAVVVASDTKLTLSAAGRSVPSSAYTNADGMLFTGMDGLKSFLDFVAGLRACAGCAAELYPHVEWSLTASRYGGSWHHKACVVLGPRPVCPPCHKLRKLFLKRVQTPYRCRSAGASDDAALARLLRRKVIRATVRREWMKQELRAMKKEVQNVSKHMVDRVLELLPTDQRASVTAALREAD